jgi:2-methylcitrate dehydratase PrpD
MWTGNKPYCCCAAQHTAIDATEEIIRDHPLEPEEIEKIIVEQMPREVKTVGNIIEPQDITAAQFSGRFGVALRLIKGGNGFNDYTMKNIKDPAILGLVRKIEFTAVEELEEKSAEAAPAIVTIKLKNGKVHKRRVDYARGTIKNPMTQKELQDKFRGLASRAIASDRAEKIIETVMGLEGMDDITGLVSLLVARAEAI